MRKISKDLAQAFMNKTAKKSGNTTTNGVHLFLHGNCIAMHDPKHNGFIIRSSGWKTTTTKDRLNALPGVSIHQSNFIWYLNGREWNGADILIPNE